MSQTTNNQTPQPDSPSVESGELKLAKQLGIVWRPATKQFLLETKRPSDDQWHTHDITYVIEAMQSALDKAVASALDAVEEELPEKYNLAVHKVAYGTDYGHDVGFNSAIDQVHQIITVKRKGLS